MALTQSQFDLRDKTLVAPLWAMAGAKALLGRDEDQILSLIDLGKLAWVFDIRRETATKRELRIFKDSLLAYYEGRELPDFSLAEVLNLILSDQRLRVQSLTVSARWLQFRFCAGSTHILNLARDGSLSLKEGEKIRVGHGRTPNILRSSVERFLTQRQIKG